MTWLACEAHGGPLDGARLLVRRGQCEYCSAPVLLLRDSQGRLLPAGLLRALKLAVDGQTNYLLDEELCRLTWTSIE